MSERDEEAVEALTVILGVLQENGWVKVPPGSFVGSPELRAAIGAANKVIDLSLVLFGPATVADRTGNHSKVKEDTAEILPYLVQALLDLGEPRMALLRQAAEGGTA